MKKMNHLPAILITGLVTLSCSYGMDAIEGLITKRASFSIEAEYNYGTDEVVVSWDESPSTSCFAGYEIYMTVEPDNEYGGYSTVAARHDPGLGIIADADLARRLGPHSKAIDVSGLSGIYYFRVGEIFYEEKPKDQWSGSTPECYEWDGTGYNYENNATLDAVSGYRGVSIP